MTPREAKRDRRTYRRGRLIKDLADLMRQDFIFYVHNVRPINRGWFKSWQLHYAQSLIENRQLFRAVKKGGSGRDMMKCNGGDCERHRLGAEPCAGCPYCDAEGNI